MGALDLEHISHHYGEMQVVKDLSLNVERGEILCLLGPSGCGKTTTLRLAAGLEDLQAGSVSVDDKTMAEPGREVPTADRRIGMVFQDYALFPHLTAAQNVAFGLHKLDKSAREAKTKTYLDKLKISHLRDKYPHTLSGGEQQRVALARALVAEPTVMLMDEPFANLDAKLRETVRDDLLNVLKREGIATMLVTHDPEEAMLMADRIAIMRDGELLQVGEPDEIYQTPASRFVAEFFGSVNVFPLHHNEMGAVAACFGPIVSASGAPDPSLSCADHELLVRTDGFELCDETNGTAAVIERLRSIGRAKIAQVRLQETGFSARLRLPYSFTEHEGATIWICPQPEFAFVFPKEKH